MSTSEERYRVIHAALVGRKLTIIELKGFLDSVGKHCPDDLARTLNIMRRKGLIKGAPCPEKGAWVWWVEE